MNIYRLTIATYSGGRLTRFVQARNFQLGAKQADKSLRYEKCSGGWTVAERAALRIVAFEEIGKLENAK